MARHSKTPNLVMKEFENLPGGGTFQDESITFEWGNISTLVEGKFHKSVRTIKITESAVSIYHLDRLKKIRRQEIESLHSLREGAISGSLSESKADVLVIDIDGRPYFVSFKEIEGQAKLGQVSADTQYGLTSLDGGINDFDISVLPIPLEFDHKQTKLSSKDFTNATDKDKKLAYYKKHHSKSWNVYVQQRNDTAAADLRKFAHALCEDRESFIEFVGITFAGSLRDSEDFYLVIGDEVVKFATVLSNLSSPRWQVTTCDASTNGKHAILINVCDDKSAYTLTRIEQSFEGGKADVIQTKGIIFHFQQHPREGMTYKRLLLDCR